MFAEIIFLLMIFGSVYTIVKVILPSSTRRHNSGERYRNYDEDAYEETKDPITQEMVGLKAIVDGKSRWA